MGMSKEAQERAKKTLGLCDEYFEAIKGALDDDGNFILDRDLKEPYRKIKEKSHTSEQKNV